MNGSEMKLIEKKDNKQNSIFNLEKNKLYELSVIQDKTSYELILELREYETAFIDDSPLKISLDMSKQQMCAYSLGNDIYIGCNKKRRS